MKNLITREEAIAKAGLKAVEAVEQENCDPTNTVGYNGKCQGDALIEWAAQTQCTDEDGGTVTLRAYYYTDEADEETAEEHGWDAINWKIEGYDTA